MTYTVKREKVEARLRAEAEKREKEKAEAAVLFKRIIGTMLIVFAAVFGRLLSLMPMPLAFVTVFVYICVQVKLWLPI